MTVQRTISPVDGRVLVERVLATEADTARAIERANTAAAGWRDTPVAARTAMIGRAIDHMVARTATELAAEITWQMGRRSGRARARSVGFEERARYMLAVAPGALADRRPEPQVGLFPVHPARAAGSRLRDRTLELSVPDRGEQHRARSCGRQRRAAEALGARPRCAPSGFRRLRRGGIADGRVPASAREPRRGAADRGQRRCAAGGLHGLGPGGAAGHAPAAAGQASSLPIWSWAARIPPMSARMPTSTMRSRTWSTGHASTRAKLLRDRAHLRACEPVRCVRRGLRGAGRAVCAGRSDRRRDPWPDGPRAAADFARGQVEEAVAQGARALIDRGGFAAGGARLRLYGAAMPDRRHARDAHHAGGELRAYRRHHAGRRRRRGISADE